MLKPMTVYELNQSIKKNLSLIYSASYGSIQNAIQKLMTSNRISCKEVVENGRNKKIYSINKSGTQDFYDWMEKDIPDNNLEVSILLRVYFLGIIESKSTKISILNRMIDVATKKHDYLKNYEDEISNIDIPKEHQKIAFYQIKTLSYGVGSHKFAMDWLKELLEETKNNTY
jgi:DNA-binding PadR family transcriptional regulator